MKRICSVVLLFAMLLSVIAVAGIMGSAENTATEIQFRGFENQKEDFNSNMGVHFVGSTSHGTYNTPAVGTGYMGGVTNAEKSELHLYAYAYNKNAGDAADGTNVDGSSQMLIADPNQMYVSFDLYVSDASVVKNASGDCGFGVDATKNATDKEDDFGKFEAWGSTFGANRQVITPMVRELKDGWNHLLIPLKVKSKSIGEKITNQTVTFRTLRFYITGVTLPVGFVAAIDDIRFMNKQAALTTYCARTTAKKVTDLIRAYPATASYNDFYGVYLTYNATPDEYKELIIGWDAFIAANEAHKAQADTDLAADQAAAADVIAAINALNKTIAKEDSQAIASARTAYDALTDNQKVLVIYSGLLTEAESQLSAIITAENKAAAKPVVDAIAALPKADKITAADRAAVEAARSAYNALTPEQQAHVTNLAVLEKAEAALAEINADGAVNRVVALIDSLPETITADDVTAVETARAAYDALTDDQKALVSNYDKLVSAEEQVENLGGEPTPGEFKLGDLDGDGLVNAKDALLILQYAVNKIDKFPVEQ